MTPPPPPFHLNIHVVIFVFVVFTLQHNLCIPLSSTHPPPIRTTTFSSCALLSTLSCIQQRGPYTGVVVPNPYEIGNFLPLLTLDTSVFPNPLNISGRQFYIGTFKNHPLVVTLTGLSVENAAIVTTLLFSHFPIVRVVMYGIAGNINPELNLGDIVIPSAWAISDLWVWQNAHDTVNDSLPLEANGDYSRELPSLYLSPGVPETQDQSGRVWPQRSEYYPAGRNTFDRQQLFYIPVSAQLFQVANRTANRINYNTSLLLRCRNDSDPSTCLDKHPLIRVSDAYRGLTGSIFVDNAYYRQFLYEKLNGSVVDMETAAVSQVSYENNVPFIAIRSVSDLAGATNQSAIGRFLGVAVNNAIRTLSVFFEELPCVSRWSSVCKQEIECGGKNDDDKGKIRKRSVRLI